MQGRWHSIAEANSANHQSAGLRAAEHNTSPDVLAAQVTPQQRNTRAGVRTNKHTVANCNSCQSSTHLEVPLAGAQGVRSMLAEGTAINIIAVHDPVTSTRHASSCCSCCSTGT
jgi:hypothetical protein